MLASIEVAHHKGNDVLIQAINKVEDFDIKQLIIFVMQILKINNYSIPIQLSIAISRRKMFSA